MEKWAVVRWSRDLRFTAETGAGGELELDSQGALRPKELLLVGQAGCTGMDVAAILQKMRAPVDRLEVTSTGTETEEHPKIFHTITVTYRCWGPAGIKDQLLRAVELSWAKYCGVTHMLNKAARMRYRVELNGEAVAEREGFEAAE